MQWCGLWTAAGGAPTGWVVCFFPPQWLWFSCRAWDALRVNAGELFRNHISHTRWLIPSDTCLLLMFPVKLPFPFSRHLRPDFDFFSLSFHTHSPRSFLFFHPCDRFPKVGIWRLGVARGVFYVPGVWTAHWCPGFHPRQRAVLLRALLRGQVCPPMQPLQTGDFDTLQYPTIPTKEICSNRQLLSWVIEHDHLKQNVHCFYNVDNSRVPYWEVYSMGC